VTDAAFEGSEEALRVVRELEPEISLVYEDELPALRLRAGHRAGARGAA
jgi:hypothetical protein